MHIQHFSNLNDDVFGLELPFDRVCHTFNSRMSHTSAICLCLNTCIGFCTIANRFHS